MSTTFKKPTPESLLADGARLKAAADAFAAAQRAAADRHAKFGPGAGAMPLGTRKRNSTGKD